jgi:hypothetical protein
MEHSSIFVLLQAFVPNEWCLKNSLLDGDLKNPRPLSPEFSVLATRPQPLTFKSKTLYEFIFFKSASLLSDHIFLNLNIIFFNQVKSMYLA